MLVLSGMAVSAPTWGLWMKGEPDVAAALAKPANEDALVATQFGRRSGALGSGIVEDGLT
jgi:hypothetical protein